MFKLTLFLGAYYYWMETHPSYLNLVIPLLMMGLHNSNMFSSASIALRDIAKECRQSIAPYNDVILNTAMVRCFIYYITINTNIL